MDYTCAKCAESPKALRLLKCVICYKQVCERCALRRYAKVFCSDNCARVFFFGDAG